MSSNLPKSVAPKQNQRCGVPDGISNRAGEWIRGRTKTCPRCETTYTRAGWLELELLGAQADLIDTGRQLELRHCPCGNTLAVEVWS